jgi:hypothetical protein
LAAASSTGASRRGVEACDEEGMATSIRRACTPCARLWATVAQRRVLDEVEAQRAGEVLDRLVVLAREQGHGG